MSHTYTYFEETKAILDKVQDADVERAAAIVASVRQCGGRLFILGLGGSAATASHAVNDFRKLCNVEAYSPSDNVAELTARANDDGLHTMYSSWLRGCRLHCVDAVMFLSVGGGNTLKNISTPLIHACDYARSQVARIVSIVGRDGGYLASRSDAAVIIPPLYPNHVTPHTEGIASVILHSLVSHPILQCEATKW